MDRWTSVVSLLVPLMEWTASISFSSYARFSSVYLLRRGTADVPHHTNFQSAFTYIQKQHRALMWNSPLYALNTID